MKRMPVFLWANTFPRKFRHLNMMQKWFASIFSLPSLSIKYNTRFMLSQSLEFPWVFHQNNHRALKVDINKKTYMIMRCDAIYAEPVEQLATFLIISIPSSSYSPLLRSFWQFFLTTDEQVFELNKYWEWNLLLW